MTKRKETGNRVKSKSAKEEKERRKTPTPKMPLGIPSKVQRALKERRAELEKAKPGPEESLRGEDNDDEENPVGNELIKLIDIMKWALQNVEDAKAEIKRLFDAWDEDEQEQVIKEWYNIFSENYDEHMETTGHYDAIRRLIKKEVCVRQFQFPVMDISAGTGVSIYHFLEEHARQHFKKGRSIKLISEGKYGGSLVYVNDLSGNMIERAKERLKPLEPGLLCEIEKLSWGNAFPIMYKTYSFRRLHSSLKGKFGTVLVSQTFHIVTPEDKKRLAKAIDWVLAPGGRVVLIEEFAWRARTHPSQAPSTILKFIDSIATPLKRKSDLISIFKNLEGQEYEMVARSIEPIDKVNQDHEMTITILRKPPGGSGTEKGYLSFLDI